MGIGDLSYGGDAEFHTHPRRGRHRIQPVPAQDGTDAPAANTCGTTGQNSTTVWTTVTDGKLTVDAVGGTQHQARLRHHRPRADRRPDRRRAGDHVHRARLGTTSAGATGYRVWRSTTLPVVMTGTPLATPTASDYTDTTALVGQVYYYAVAPATGTTASVVGAMIDDRDAPATPTLAGQGQLRGRRELQRRGQGHRSPHRPAGPPTPARTTPTSAGSAGSDARRYTARPDQERPIPAQRRPAYSPTLTSTMHMQGNTVNGSPDRRSRAPGSWRSRTAATTSRRRRSATPAAGADPTSHTVNVEGINVDQHFAVRRHRPVPPASRTRPRPSVTDGFLTVDAIGGINTKIDYITVTPTPTDQPPAKPTGLTATAGDAARWRCPGRPTPTPTSRATTSSAAPTATVATTTPLNADADRPATTFTDTTAVNGTTYYYVVVAVDDADQSLAVVRRRRPRPRSRPTRPSRRCR